MKESKFNGTVVGNFATNALFIITCIFSLGFAMPWAICRKEKWKAKHTIIDGKQLVFDGTGKELFHKFIKWLLLSFITLGIYSVWSTFKVQKWVINHTHLEKIA